MTQIYQDRHEITFHAADRYPTSNTEANTMGLSGGKNEEMRAMTIAAFRVAQNNTNLSNYMMATDLLKFLLGNSDSAIRHWVKQGRLENATAGIRLSQEGLNECHRSLEGATRGYNTRDSKVQEWINRMLNGDQVATESRVFTLG
jgi:hypothetical protein